jgi:hypothetical protein
LSLRIYRNLIARHIGFYITQHIFHKLRANALPFIYRQNSANANIVFTDIKCP